MGSSFLDERVLDELSTDEFRTRRPFPWSSFDQLLTPSAFSCLLADFPSLHLFEWNEGRRGQHYERPQNRWFLEYTPDRPSRPGSARTEDLPLVWQRFIEELLVNSRYREFVAGCLGRDDLEPRLTWHLGVNGSEVCPHVDSDNKVGTHIFYFNRAGDDWDPSWGGDVIVLAEKREDVQFPDFVDFAARTVVETTGNRSFLFMNGPRSWHGVPALSCPDAHYRRLFNVVFQTPTRVRQHGDVAATPHATAAPGDPLLTGRLDVAIP